MSSLHVLSLTIAMSALAACSSANKAQKTSPSATPNAGTKTTVANPSGPAAPAGPVSTHTAAPAVAANPVVSLQFQINPSPVFTGFNGRDSYQAPVISKGGSGAVKWQVDKPNLVQISANADGTMMMTTKGAGTVQLTATDAKGITAKTTVTIAAYTTADWDAGKLRYTTQMAGETQPCSHCHGTGLTTPDHTPAQIDSDDDATVEKSYTTGVNPDGVPINGGNHKWMVTNPKGIMAYIRSLAPRGYPTGP